MHYDMWIFVMQEQHLLLRRRRLGENEKIYEMDKYGQRILVQSLDSLQKAYLRFTNKTSRIADIWWRDFEGYRQHYGRLPPGGYRDITTYITHPWEFTDIHTKENFVINNQIVFRAPKELGRMPHRTNWNVTVTVRSLKRTVMLQVASILQDPFDVVSLDLPRVLETDLRQLVEIMHPQPQASLEHP